MTVTIGVERPYGAVSPGSELLRAPVGVTAQSVSIYDVGTTPLTTVTATIHCASIVLPGNLPVNGITLHVTTAGTVTGLWVALLDAARVVRAVSANNLAPTTGYLTFPVLPASAVAYVTPGSGLYYVAIGTVSSVAPAVAAMAAMPAASLASGPPIYTGNSATAATVTPPPVGTILGAITGQTTTQFYAHTT